VLLYLPDITESERRLAADELFFGESFAPGVTLRGYHLAVAHYRAGDAISLKIAGDMALEASCDRCGAPLEVSVELDEPFILFPASAGEADYVYGDEAIELDPFIHEAIVLNIPPKILCSEDCRGLCPTCGRNLNDAACGCKKND